MIEFAKPIVITFLIHDAYRSIRIRFYKKEQQDSIYIQLEPLFT